jgi:hypothetical protein
MKFTALVPHATDRSMMSSNCSIVVLLEWNESIRGPPMIPASAAVDPLPTPLWLLSRRGCVTRCRRHAPVYLRLNAAQESLAIDGFADVVLAARLKTFLPIPDHRAGGRGNDRAGIVTRATRPDVSAAPQDRHLHTGDSGQEGFQDAAVP